MRISCLQMDVVENRPAENRRRAEALIRAAAAEACADVAVLPETWNLGFAPGSMDASLADCDGEPTNGLLSALSRTLSVNIVAGSVVDRRGGGLYNAAFVFDRDGRRIASYDKTHLFSPMGEEKVFCKGGALSRFPLDGAACGVIICYDLRFPELTRTLSLEGLDILFIVSQWPAVRSAHLRTLAAARAIENQVFVALCNGCGTAAGTRYGGGSAIIDPFGTVLCEAGETETTITADVDLAVLAAIRSSIPVFRDRREELYKI